MTINIYTYQVCVGGEKKIVLENYLYLNNKEYRSTIIRNNPSLNYNIHHPNKVVEKHILIINIMQVEFNTKHQNLGEDIPQSKIKAFDSDYNT